MPNIYLCEKSNEYGSGNANFSVKEEKFEYCNLFRKFKHQNNDNLVAEDIYVFISNSNVRGSVILRSDWKINKDSKLASAYVYFNRYENISPLIVVLHFDNKIKLYYKLSNFKTDMSNSKNISELNNYINDKSMLDELIDENNKIINYLTYNLANIETYYKDRIVVKEDSNNIPKPEQNWFKRYQHKPQNNCIHWKSCVMNGKEEMMEKNGTKEFTQIDNIQQQTFSYVNVYLSTRFKTPLLAEFVKNNGQNHSEYYCFYKDDKNLYYSEKLNDSTFKRYTHINPKGNIHKELTNDDKTSLKLLKKLESYMFETVVIMFASQNEYSKNDIPASFLDLDKCRPINSNSHKIPVRKAKFVRCIGNTQYNVLEHDLSNVKHKENEAKLKLVIHTNQLNRCNEITLYNGNYADPENIDCLNYLTNKKWEKKLYVYFYNKDPRPLLVCYNGNAYKPKDLEGYFTDWVKVEEIGECQHYRYNEKLIGTLSEVVGFLNQVNIYKNQQYRVHIYNNRETHIKVKTDYHSSCFISHEHTPETGYTLGYITYEDDNQNIGTITRSNTIQQEDDPLRSVTAYYFNKDYQRQYPLLVQIKFRSRTKQYYKLISRSGNKLTWAKEQDTDLTSKITKTDNNMAWYLTDVLDNLEESEYVDRRIKCHTHHSIEENTKASNSRIGQSDDGRAQASQNDLTVPRVTSMSQNYNDRQYRERETRALQERLQYARSHYGHAHPYIKEPQETGVQKATRIASTVGTFALAGTGIGIAIHKYSQWFIALFRRLF